MATTLDITDFGKSSSNMKSKFIAGLRERFALNRVDGAEPSPLNAGIIGYMADMFGNAVEDHYFNVNSRSKEMFVSSAKFDDSMYMQASTCKMSDFFAVPAVIDLLLAIPVRDIIANAIPRQNLGYSMMTLSGKTQFILDRFYYLLDYPVDIIVKRSSNNEDIISCRYQIDSNRNPFSDLEANYIPGQIQNIQGMNYYVFKVRAHQLGLTEYNFQYNSSSNMTDVYEYAYEAQLAGFRVWHKSADDDDWELLENKYSGVLVASSNDKFCYYRLLDGKIEISFSNDPSDWKPDLNDKFKVQIFETEGASANFEYTAYDIVPYMFQDSSLTYENAFSGIIPVAQLCTTKSSGGVDMPTIEDLRAKIIDFKASRETIISDGDLKRIAALYGLNLIKQRDDIYRRQFITFALIKNSETGFILPGRTGELYLPETDTINQNEVDSRLVPPGNVYQFWLSDDQVSYNTKRFIAKQPEDIQTAVTARTNYFKMSVSNSYNIELADNLTELATMISFNNQNLYFGNYTSDPDAIAIPDPNNAYSLVAFYSDNCNTAYFMDGEIVGRTVFVRSLTKTVQVDYKSSISGVMASANIIPSHEYKFVWESSGWTVTDLGVIGTDPASDGGLIPSIDHIDIPIGERTGTSFILKNHASTEVNVNWFDYGSSPATAQTTSLKVNGMIKFYWTGSTWTVTDLGKEGELTTPTSALADKDWSTLYNYYTKYNGVLMMCPYMIKIFKNPYFVSLYDVQCDTTLSTIFQYNNYNSPEKFAITGISVKRDDIRNNSYEVSCEVAVSDTIYEAFTTGDINEFPVKIKIELFKNDVTDCFFELENIETTDVVNRLKFSTTLVTDNVLHQNDMIRILNRNNTGIEGSANVMPTNDNVYAGTGIIPNTWFIPFKSKLKAYILYAPDTAFDNEYGGHLLEESDINAGFVVTDAFETDDMMHFVTDVSDVFSTTLEVVKSSGILPKYPSDVPMTYESVVYQTDSDGNPVLDENNEYVVLHHIGDPVVDNNGNQIYAHRAGDDVIQKDSSGNLIYDVAPETIFVIKNIPLISMMTMLDDDNKTLTYKSLKSLTKNIQEKILPKLIENNQIVLSVYNTFGPSSEYVQGSKNTFAQLDNLNVSIELNVKFDDSISDTDSIVDSIKSSIEEYMNGIVNTGYFYASELLKTLREQYSDITYLEFVSINGKDSSVQTIKKVEDSSDSISTPEYITIGQLLDEDAFKKDGTVTLTPNITINTIM